MLRVLFTVSIAALAGVFSASSKATSSQAKETVKQLVQYLKIDLAKFILTDSIVPQSFLLDLATSKRDYVEQELIKQKEIYFAQIIGKLHDLTDKRMVLTFSSIPDAIEVELNEQLQEFISVFSSDTHDIMQVTKLYFPVKNLPKFLLDNEYGLDVFISDDKDNAIDSITMLKPKNNIDHYFNDSDLLASEMSDGLIFTPYHYILNGNSGVHLFERKSMEHKYLALDTLSGGSGERSIRRIADNSIAVVNKIGEDTQTVHRFHLSPPTKMEVLTYTGELLQFSSSGELVVVWGGEQLVIYGTTRQQFAIDKSALPCGSGENDCAKPIMTEFTDADRILSVVVGDDLNGYRLVHIDMVEEAIISMNNLPDKPIQLLGAGSSTYVLTAKSLLRFDADGELAYRQSLQYSQPKHLYAYGDQRSILIYDKHLQILRTDDGGEDFTLYVGDKFRIVDHTVSDRYTSLLIEKFVHDARFSLTLVQIPIARIIAMFQEDQLLKLAPYAMLDLSHNRALPLIWNGKAFTLQ